MDEAQRLRRPPGHPGEPAYRAIAPIAALGRHVLLLSATPLEDDAHGFFRLLQLLRPEEFPEGLDVEARLASGVPLPPCTSSTRRVDIGGLPPRAPVAVDLPLDATEPALARVERDLARVAMRARCRIDPVARRRALDRIRRALASGAALKAVLGPDETELRQQAEAMDRSDPRLQWLLTQAPRWRRANEKTLVFVAHRETLEMLRDALSARAQLASGVFHEELSAARRDTEVARFRADDGPSLLVSTEAGGEGRNFEFCHRLVLFDLPWKPSAVEQRIGRLDRIGRRIPVEIVYFRPPSGIGADVVRLFERLGLFREPMAGVEPQLAHVESALEAIALDPDASLSDAQLEQLIAAAQAARTRIREAAYQQLHRDPYRAEMGPSILAPRPAGPRRAHGTGRRQRRFAAWLSRRAGARPARLRHRVRQRGARRQPARRPGRVVLRRLVRSRGRGRGRDASTSSRRAIRSSKACWRISRRIRRAASRGSRCASRARRGTGLIAIYKDGPQFEVVAFDADGRARPDWADAFRRRPLSAREDEGRRRRGARLAGARDASRAAAREPPPPHAIAAVVVLG